MRALSPGPSCLRPLEQSLEVVHCFSYRLGPVLTEQHLKMSVKLLADWTGCFRVSKEGHTQHPSPCFGVSTTGAQSLS